MPKLLLSVPHLLQQSDGDCLAACAAYVTSHHLCKLSAALCSRLRRL